MVGKNENIRPMWQSLKREIAVAEPTPIVNQVSLGCTQREARVDMGVVQSKSEFRKRLTTSGTTDEMDLTKESKAPMKIIAWSCDIQGHEEKCVERHCALAKETASSLQLAATPCIDDHLLPPEDFESK